MTERPSSRRVLGVLLEDLRRAGEGVWLLLSLLSLVTLGWGLAASEETLLRWSAWLRGGHDALHPCLLCGMTRAWVAASEGSWAQASSLHPGILPLLGLYVLNLLMLLGYLTRAAVNRLRSLSV